MKYDRRYTPGRISELKENEIFVFGSNLAGAHGGGAARLAYDRFGAVWGEGVGLHGRTYAIPTMQGGVETIRPYVDEFIRFAKENVHLTFLVTRIGCGIAGFRDEEIAPLFREAIDVRNIVLPREFVECIPLNDAEWDAAQWIKDFKAYSEAVKRFKDRHSMGKIRNMRAGVFQHTVSLVKKGGYTMDGRDYKFAEEDAQRMIQGTCFYDSPLDASSRPSSDYETVFTVENADCLTVAKGLKDRGYNIAVLNMASRQNPGGGVLNGAGAQEENLFRRTNLFLSMFQFARYANQYGLDMHRKQYPLDRNFGGIYTSDATVFRGEEKKGYPLLGDDSFRVSFIAVSGINRPALKDATHLADNMVDGTKNKMRTILRIGLLHGHDSLVLGAMGCGAFCNPPSHIARLFHDVFEEPEFKNKYRLVCFAILDDHNAHRSHNPEGNYLPFLKEFCI